MTIKGKIYSLHRDLKKNYPVKKTDGILLNVKLIQTILQSKDVICWPTTSQLSPHITHCTVDHCTLIKANLQHACSQYPTGLLCIKCSRAWVPIKNYYIPQLSEKAIEKKTIQKPKCNVIARKTPIRQLILEELPQSTIVVIHLDSLSQKKKHVNYGCVILVSNVSDANPNMGIYWVGKSFSSTLLFAIKLKKLEKITYRDQTFNITSYRVRSEDKERFNKYLDIIGRFCDPLNPQVVHVFALKKTQQLDTNTYEEVTAMIPCSKTTFPVAVMVYYEKSTGYYFMNEDYYNSLRNQYGLPYMRVRPVVSDSKGAWVANLRPQSELGVLGYTVGVTSNLSVAQRRKILSTAMASQILAKHEIINHLEWLVHFNGQKSQMRNAVEEWLADLNFVRNFNLEQQRKIWINAFQSKYSGIKKIAE